MSVIGHSLAAVGVLALLYYIGQLLQIIYVQYLRPAKNLKKYGDWAAVTGATDGIGKEMAIELAMKGLNLLLISRTESKLQGCTREIKEKYPTVAVEYVVADLSEMGEAEYARVAAALDKYRVGLLVNNAGLSYGFPSFLAEVDDSTLDNIIEVNNKALVRLTKIVIPKMERSGGGYIVNIGSGVASRLPNAALTAVYGGSKAFVDHFSRSLYLECKAKKICVTCLVPLHVSTKMSKLRKISLDVPTAQTWAKASMKHIGQGPVEYPYWYHSFQGALLTLIPDFILNSIWLSMMLKVRSRALKKAAKAE